MRVRFLDGLISLLLYDFDGVMTDNKVILDEDGRESVSCNRSDGLAVSAISRMGIPQAIISTEKNKVVASRAMKLNIPVIQSIDNKKETVFAYCEELHINPKETLYIGNDFNDLEVMLSIGFPICPNDAYREIQEISRLILPVGGGGGVIRKLLDYLHMSGECPIPMKLYNKKK
jgi:YrbI family 3-deoxy-D-manno-octulosonate 8-phosphate phosphatase